LKAWNRWEYSGEIVIKSKNNLAKVLAFIGNNGQMQMRLILQVRMAK
jgi:hypothetical protein